MEKMTRFKVIDVTTFNEPGFQVVDALTETYVYFRGMNAGMLACEYANWKNKHQPIGEITVKLTLDTSDFDRQLQRVMDSVKRARLT